ncbi:hypothetical protein LINPERHAP1_LOCUS21706 [Linum perenne]
MASDPYKSPKLLRTSCIILILIRRSFDCWKSFGYSYLCRQLISLWKPEGNMSIVDLNKDCYLVKFGSEQDYFKALTCGPWMILDHYLIVQQCDPSFRVSDNLPTKMVV